MLTNCHASATVRLTHDNAISVVRHPRRLQTIPPSVETPSAADITASTLPDLKENYMHGIAHKLPAALAHVISGGLLITASPPPMAATYS